MKKLPETEYKNGYLYRQFVRNNNVALYEQYDKDRLVAYEVFIVQKQNGGYHKLGGVDVYFEEKEKLPSNEEFGSIAFSYMPNQWSEAIDKYEKLNNYVENKKEK